MTNEVQVNVTRGGSWRGAGPDLNLYHEISLGQTEGQTHRKCITADAGHVRHKRATVTYKEISEKIGHLG